MSDDHGEPAGDQIRALRLARGMSQQEVANALDISPKTVGRLEREGRGHHLRRVRNFLESLGSESGLAGATSIRSFVRQESVAGHPPLALVLHEFAALLDRLPEEQRGAAAQTFIDVQRQLDDGTIDQMKTLEAAAHVTVKAFLQFVSNAIPK